MKNSSAKQAKKFRRQFFDIYILFSKLRNIETHYKHKDLKTARSADMHLYCKTLKPFFMKLKLLLIIAALSGIASCTKDRFETDSTFPVSQYMETKSFGRQVEFGKETVLGEKIEDPYSLKTMRKAVRQLKLLKYDDAFANITDIQASHLYIKFTPRDTIDLELLNRDDNILLYNHPLDREILVSGPDYHDPEIPENALPYLYASVPVGYPLLNEVDHIVLDSLYFPDESPEYSSGIFNIENVYTLENAATALTENRDTDFSISLSADDHFYPEGYVRMYDSYLDSDVYLEGAKVILRKGTHSHAFITDKNGYFKSDKRFKQMAGVHVYWEANPWYIKNDMTKTHSYFGTAYYNDPGPFVCDIYEGMYKVPSFGAIHRAIHKFCYAPDEEVYGLSRPKSLTKIAIKYIHVTATDENGHMNPSRIFNDIVIYYQGTPESNEVCKAEGIYKTTMHELAHFIHCHTGGLAEFNRTKNFIKESWAVFVAWLLTNDTYTRLGKPIDNKKYYIPSLTISPKSHELITIPNPSFYYIVPNYVNYQNWYTNSNSSTNKYRYTPLFIDLYDNSNQYGYERLINPDKDTYLYVNDLIKDIPPRVLQDVVYRSENKSDFMNIMTQMCDEEKYNLTQETLNTMMQYYELVN